MRYSLELQGLFFAFLSAAALIQLGDFGVAYATLQMAGRLRARQDKTGMAELRWQARRRGLAWIAATATAVGLGVAFAFPEVPGVHWLAPWLTLAVCAALMQWMQVELAWCEGAISARVVWQLRFAQEAAGCVGLVACLLVGGGLWSLGLYFGLRASIPLAWRIKTRVLMLSPLHLPASSTPGFNWRQDLWHFQWRIGLSALAGYLTMQAITPILLITQGPQAAATFGLGLTGVSMLLLFTTAWPLSQSARFVAQLSKGSVDEAREHLRRLLMPSLSLTVLIGFAAWALVAWLKTEWPVTSARLPDMASFALLLCASCALHATACFAVVLRAERMEPLLRINVWGALGGLTVMALASLLGGLPAVATAYFAHSVLNLWVAQWHCRQLWRRHAAASSCGQLGRQR